MKNYKTKLQELRKDHEFMAFIEETMKIPVKMERVIYFLKATKRDEYDNVPRRFPYYITYRDVAKLIKVSKGRVYDGKALLIEEIGNKKEKIDSSGTRHIGEGNEFVYLFYFWTYKQYAESEDLDYWQCNIGHTQSSPEDRVASQIGDQLPEKATLSLVMQTHDCETLEARIHTELKRRGRWLNPKSDTNVVGEEWFSTNPAEVEDIFYSVLRNF